MIRCRTIVGKAENAYPVGLLCGSLVSFVFWC